ncbi:hypothetical protein HY989_00430 [Candidatus Micrarchaeota archaeon]|nr:hypothetical protein [Candidatus Micrarchaeota archaeon]
MMYKKTLFATLLLLVLISILMLLGNKEKPQIGIVGEIHYHADFKVFIEGFEINFSNPKYMSADNSSLSKFTHLHDMNGEILHVHAKGVTLGMFFKSLRMEFTSECLLLDGGKKYCPDGEKNLKLYVNGVYNPLMHEYMPQDLDRILITYGNEPESSLKSQMESVKNNACIYSEKCPQRGSPPLEAGCVGGNDCIA